MSCLVALIILLHLRSIAFAESWILDHGSWILHLQPYTLNIGPWILDIESWIFISLSRSPSRGFGRFRSPGATLANPCEVFKSLSYLRSSLAKIQLLWAHPAIERRRIPRLRAHGVLTSVSGTRGQGTGTALETSPVHPGSAREARKGASGCKKERPGRSESTPSRSKSMPSHLQEPKN